MLVRESQLWKVPNQQYQNRVWLLPNLLRQSQSPHVPPSDILSFLLTMMFLLASDLWRIVQTKLTSLPLHYSLVISKIRIIIRIPKPEHLLAVRECF